MPTIVDLKERYETQIFQNEPLKQLCDRMASDASKKGRRRGVPKALQNVVDDHHFRNGAACWRRVMKYHERVGNLTRKRLRGKRVYLNEEIALIRLGANVEHDCHEAIKSAFAGTRSNIELTKAMATATLETVPVEHLPILAHPAAVTKREVDILKYCGISMRDYRRQFYYHTKAENFDVLNLEKGLRLIESENFEPLLKEAERTIEQVPYTEAPRYLVKRDLITFGGDWEAPTGYAAASALTTGSIAVPGTVAVVGVAVIGIILIAVIAYSIWG